MKVCLIFFFGAVLSFAGAPALAYCVIHSGVSLHAGPSSTTPVTWKVSKFMPLQPTGEKKSGWVEVEDVDGQKHWISSQDISTRLTCLVVSSKRTRLRTGPGTKFETSVAGIADRYTPFVDLGGEDGWTQVEDEMGQRSWINLDQTWKASKRLRMVFDSQ